MNEQREEQNEIDSDNKILKNFKHCLSVTMKELKHKQKRDIKNVFSYSANFNK